MTQRTLFPTNTPPKLARDTDPETSHDAAKRTNRAIDRARVLAVFRLIYPTPMTLQEIAQECCRLHYEFTHTRFETYRKRGGELTEIVETGEKRNGQRLWVLKEEEV